MVTYLMGTGLTWLPPLYPSRQSEVCLDWPAWGKWSSVALALLLGASHSVHPVEIYLGLFSLGTLQPRLLFETLPAQES